MYELVIKNGTVCDGTGGEVYVADVAIRDGRLCRIGRDLKGLREIDAAGLVVSPGFIDSHSHSDKELLTVPAMTQKAEQGITTCVAGLCGSTVAPVSPHSGKYADYRDMTVYLDRAGQVPQGVNTACFSGHLALRRAVMGSEDRRPTAREQRQMEDLLRRELEGGTLGISFGMVYAPGCFADQAELEGLCAVARSYDGVAAFHIRDEGDRLIEATGEMLAITRETGVRTVLSHHKAMGKANWGKVRQTLDMLDAANREGMDIYCDLYPYTASATTLASRFLPKAYFDGGFEAAVERLKDPANRQAVRAWNVERYGQRLDWVLVTSCRAYPQYVGKYMDAVARLHGKDAYETVFDMICDGSDRCGACFFLMSEEDVVTVLKHPRAMIGTDSSVTKNLNATFHPRMLGTFPRVLGRYVRQQGAVPLPEMIRKMTGLPAAVYGLERKGLLKEGYDADICVFDPETVLDRADYVQCHRKNQGLRYVFVNGVLAVEDNLQTDARAGRILRRA